MSLRAAAALMLLFSAVPAVAQHRPAIVLNGDRLFVRFPESILKEREVRKQLDSALTTTFVVKARIRGAKAEPVARLEIRYDLWDEVFHVKRVERDAKPVEQTIAGAAQLEQWWRTPLFLARLDGDRAVVDVELIVLPFSGAEESDARQWLSKSGGAAGPESSPNVVDVLIGTSLSARPIVSYRWSAEVVRR